MYIWACQSLLEHISSASELHSWFDLNFNLIYELISQIKLVGLSVVFVYY